MDLGIDGKVALVHAAGGGLGGAIAVALAREGAHVVACDRESKALEETADRLSAIGARFALRRWDLADLGGFDAALADVQLRCGEIDILINNSGGPPPGPAADIPPEHWRSYFESMVLALVRMTDLVLPDMRRRGWGRVITSASSGVIAPIPNLGLSNTLRSALVGWSKTLAREVGPEGITANVLVPGRIATARIEALDEAKAAREGRRVEDVVAESTASIPAGRYGRPEEYAAVAAFLASNSAAYVNGSVIRVDGGLIPSI